MPDHGHHVQVFGELLGNQSTLGQGGFVVLLDDT